jgi:hypothetical protein
MVPVKEMFEDASVSPIQNVGMWSTAQRFATATAARQEQEFFVQDAATRRSKSLLFDAAMQNRFHQQESVLPQPARMLSTIQATSSIVIPEVRVPRLLSNSGSRYLLADAQRQHQYHHVTN